MQSQTVAPVAIDTNAVVAAVGTTAAGVGAGAAIADSAGAATKARLKAEAAAATSASRLKLALPNDRPFWVMFTIFVVMFVCLFMQLGCASREKVSGSEAAHADSYEDVIKRNTRQDKQYEGFYNKFEVYATFLNSEVQAALLQKKGDAFKWNAKQAQTEREKLFQENSNQTKFALSFYVPSVRLNDLHKNTSIWRVYLDVGGQRYEGKVTRHNGKLEEIQTLFDYHNRWSVAYDVSFNVPLSGVENVGAGSVNAGPVSSAESGHAKSQPVTLTLTSTQGTATLTY